MGDAEPAEEGAAPAEEEQPEEAPPEEQQPEAEPEPVEEEPPPPPPIEERTVTFEKTSKVQVDANPTTQNLKYLSTLPVVPESNLPYTPILYTFRVKPRSNSKKLRNISSKAPPFFLLFDHAIAVVWTLFSKQSNKGSLGISQLQWALYFLKSIFNSEGVHPRDVQTCIDTIESYLIDEYAEMSQEGVVYSECEEVADVEKPAPVSFSLNYTLMSKKIPISSGCDAEEADKFDAALLKELENVKTVVGINSVDLTKVVSRDQVMNILNDWKKEQIDKIEEEMKLLYVVEDMMKNSDEQNFEGYTDETQFKSIFKKN